MLIPRISHATGEVLTYSATLNKMTIYTSLFGFLPMVIDVGD